jgi:hypothetical protein
MGSLILRLRGSSKRSRRLREVLDGFRRSENESGTLFASNYLGHAAIRSNFAQFTVSRSAESKTFIIIAVVNREWNPPSLITCETGRKFSLLAGGKQNDPKVSIVNFDAAAHAFFISFDYKQEIVCIMTMTTSFDALSAIIGR